jgi:hypothetical protein
MPFFPVYSRTHCVVLKPEYVVLGWGEGEKIKAKKNLKIVFRASRMFTLNEFCR